MVSYDMRDISSCLAYIADRFGIEVFSIQGRVTAILSDLAPALTSERVMIDRMSRRSILSDFAKANTCSVTEKERIITKSLMTLIDCEFIAPNIAARYVKILVDIFHWNLPVDLPKSLNTSYVIQFDAKQYLIDSEDQLYRSAMAVREQENYDETFRLFKKAYHQGNLLAGIKMAQLYRDGLGCLKSDEKAIQFFMIGYKENHPLAAAWVAEHYRMGRGVPKDRDKALQIYNSCKDALVEMCICGDPDAQYFWGFDLLYNTFGNGDDKQAFQWLEKASSSSRIARVDLAKCYLNGWGCSADIDKGIELLRQCAEGKSKKARYELGLLYYLGKHVEQDYNKAFTLFEYAAQKNHASAQYYLGDMYFWGKGVVKDEAKAFEWNKKSADNGNRFGCESIAYQYWNGRVVPKNEKLAFKYFKEAADKGVINSQYILHYFLCGLVEDKSFVDYELCCSYLEKAATNGHAEASRKLADMYLYEEYGMVDDQKYYKWIYKAAELGDSIGEMMLGTMYQSGFVVNIDYTQAIHWLTKASNKKQVDAYVRLAEIYLTGSKIASDSSKAFEYLAKASNLLKDNESTCYHSREYLRMQIARMYNEYSRNVFDKRDAIELFCQSWHNGNTEILYDLGWMYFVQKYRSTYAPIDPAILITQLRTEAPKSDSRNLAYLLGVIYYNGLYPYHSEDEKLENIFGNDYLEFQGFFGVDDGLSSGPNKNEAEKWWLMALQKGSHSAYGRLIVYYANDLQDSTKAFRMAEKGHLAGSSEATYYLGLCYSRGIGVKKSRAKAKEYFKEAAAKGYEDAQKELKKYLF